MLNIINYLNILLNIKRYLILYSFPYTLNNYREFLPLMQINKDIYYI